MRRDREWYRAEVAMRLARVMAHLSTCRRLAVGCAIVTEKLQRVVAVGYNGPPVGCPNDACTGEAGRCGCVHAECNALVKAGADVGDMYVTHSPCLHCAGLIANSGGRVRRVVYGVEFRETTGLDRLRSAGVDVLRYADVVPRVIVLGERENASESELEASPGHWWRSSLARGAFLDRTSTKKLASAGVDLTRVRSANLLPPSPVVGEWDVAAARQSWLTAAADQPGATWMTCGGKAWTAATGKAGGRADEVFELPCGGRVIPLPHPSGLNRWWNDRANPTRLRRRLRGLLGGLVVGA